MCAANLLPRRRELLELAVHRAPRRFHRIKSGRKPSERRDQPRHAHARSTPYGPVHVHFRIRNINQALYVHQAPPGVIALEIFRSCPAPRRCRNAIDMP